MLGTTALVAVAMVCGCTPSASAGARAPDVPVQVLAINDLHGNLDPTESLEVDGRPAGGVAYLASHVARLRARNPAGTVVVTAGDLVGASPLLSSLFHDEPTVEAMNELGLDASAMGNHELDEGSAELLRLAGGGCHPSGGCRDGDGYGGARFPFLAANTRRTSDGQTLFPPYVVKDVDGVKVAFVGLTLQDTPSVVAPGGTDGLTFADEADTVNALVPELRRQGARAIVVLLHEGLRTTGAATACDGISGPVLDIVRRTSPEVDAFVTGHTHQAYDCVIDGRPVTGAGSYGRLLTSLSFDVDRVTGEPSRIATANHVVTRDVPADPRETALLAKYHAVADPIAHRVVARLDQPLLRGPDLGTSIADAHRAATDADVALVLAASLRADVPAGEVTHADTFAAQPDDNDLVTLTLRGADLARVLAQQDDSRRLYPSSGFSPDSVAAERSYRVTVVPFLAEGGNGFSAFRAATRREPGPSALGAWERHLALGLERRG